MKKLYGKRTEQLEWSMVKEEAGEKRHVPAKRVDIEQPVPVRHTIQTQFCELETELKREIAILQGMAVSFSVAGGQRKFVVAALCPPPGKIR